MPHAERAHPLFAFLWACAVLFHMANQVMFSQVDLLYLLTALAALFLAVRPSSVRGLLVLSSLVVLHATATLPDIANHWFLCLLLALAILASWLTSCWVWRSIHFDRAALFEEALPVVRGLFLVSYAFAALAKFNHDFLDPEVSCAATFFRLTLTGLGLESPVWGERFAILVTLVAEAALVPLLMVRRTRRFGVLVGSIFHFALAVTPVAQVSDFSVLMLALLFLFTPPAFTERIHASVLSRTWLGFLPARSVLRALPIAMFLALAAFAVAGQGRVPNLYSARDPWSYYYGAVWIAYLGFGIGWLGLLARHLFDASAAAAPPLAPPFRWRRAHATVLVALALANGLSPYLGFKTKTSFTMFSNLRTEGHGSNHFLIPQLYLANYQNELVEILDSSHWKLQEFAEQKRLVTWFQLIDITSRNPSISLRYVRNGELHEVHRVATVPELSKPHPWWLRKILIFRGVDKDGVSRCQH